jgi:RNA polymerase sigma-70 factor (sigma-E family)
MAAGANYMDFEAFAKQIRYWLRREAYDICGDWHEADDLVQVALVKTYSRWNDLSRHDELRAYARKVVFSTFLTERRRLRWRRELTTPIPLDQSKPPNGYDGIDDRSVLLPAMRRLGTRQRAVLSLRFLLDLSVVQTAAILDCAPSTVTSQTARALDTLRRDLTIRPPPPERSPGRGRRSDRAGWRFVAWLRVQAAVARDAGQWDNRRLAGLRIRLVRVVLKPGDHRHGE